MRVRLLVDDWHLTPEADRLLAAMASHPNIEVRLFNPFGTHRRTFLARALGMAFGPNRLKGRMHNKAFIVDNSVAIVGGRNIGAEYFGASPGANFYDIDIIALGPVTREVSAMFDDYWNCVLSIPINALVAIRPTADDLKSARRDLATQRNAWKNRPTGLKVEKSDLLKRIDTGKASVAWGQAQVLSDHPLKCVDPDDPKRSGKMAQELKGILEEGRSELLMVSPYLVPGEAGMRLVQKMRDHGVSIKIITNSFRLQ